MKVHINNMVQFSAANDEKPLSVARLEEKALELAKFLNLQIEELN